MSAAIHQGLVSACASKTLAVLKADLTHQYSPEDEKKRVALLQTIQKAPNFADNFSYEDLGDFLQYVYGSVKSPLETVTSEEMEPPIRTFLEKREMEFEFYINIGEAVYFDDEYELGKGQVVSFAALPSYAQEYLIRQWELEFKFDRIPGELQEYLGSRKKYWYLRTRVSSIGSARAVQKALVVANRSIALARLFFLYDDAYLSQGVEHSFEGWYGFFDDGNVISSRQTGDKKMPLLRISLLDEEIHSANEVLKTDHPTDLDECIINTIDVFGLIRPGSPLNVRFLITVIAIESLLAGEESEDSISSRLSERIASLLGDAPAWMIMKYGIKREELTEEYINSHLADSRIALQSEFKKIYSKRSGVAHEGLPSEDRGISKEDYNLANTLLRFALQRLLQLRRAGVINRIGRGTKPDEKSLIDYLNQLKYSFKRFE